MSSEEVVEGVDVSECVDESNNLYLRKVVMMLKQDYNFSLESNHSNNQTRKYPIIWKVRTSGSTAVSTQLVKI